MKLPALRVFTAAVKPTFDQVVSYLQREHSSNINDLVILLKRLSFSDNFESFQETVIIPATAEVAIENKLRGAIPTQRLFVRSNSADVVDGDTEWTENFVYLKNLGASEATVTVVFIK